jgi:tetratricopeptide (TPR) repeat protein
MGLTYLNLSDNKEAISAFKKAVDNQPEHTLSLNSLAEVLHLTGKTNEAIEILKKIIKIKPDFDKAYFNLSLMKLIFSNFKEGWQQYEYRWKVKPFREVKWPFAREEMWNNEEGKRVSLWKEQGIGDEIIFLGLIPEAKERSQSLAVYIDPRLVPLCERSMPGIKFFGDTKEFEKQAFDYHMPMGSLPRLFRSDIKDFDRTAHGYLKADELRVDILRREMGLEGKRVIGISWKSIRSLTTSKKSMMLKDFGMMFKGMDVVLLNLQYGDVQEEIDEFTQATGIEILQCESVDNREDLDGLAALIELCDLVVSTSNITIHLAGALGKETWVLLPYVANFWWLLDRTDSIWYPALRLYRQKTLDDWGGVLSNINKDLQKKFGE